MIRAAVRSSIALAATAAVAACAGNPNKGTLGSLHQVAADTREVQVDNGLDRAVQGYQRFLAETPDSQLTPEAMRRLADLKVEKEYGLLGDGKLVEMPASAGSAAAGSTTVGSAASGTWPGRNAVVVAAAAAKPTSGSVKMPAPGSTPKIDARAAGHKVLKGTTPASTEADIEKRMVAEQPTSAPNTVAILDLPDGVDRSLE